MMTEQKDEQVDVIDDKMLDWKKEDLIDEVESKDFYRFYPGSPPVRTPDFDKLVPMNLQNIVSPQQLVGDQLDIIAKGIAQITLQAFCQINWPYLCRETPGQDTAYVSFRHKFFTTLTKLALNIFDMEDFQRCVDEVNINKTCKFFGDHLHHRYGSQPESFYKAMQAITQGELDFNQFPYLREQDVGFTLWHYYLDCTGTNNLECPWEVCVWPYVWSPVDHHYLVCEHHTSSVIKAVKEYVPLTVEQKLVILSELDKDCKKSVLALCLEPWKDMQVKDFEMFESAHRGFGLDMVVGPFLFTISNLTDMKAKMLRLSKKIVMFPIESRVFGMFADEVLDVIGIANLLRTRAGQRFISGTLILEAIRRSSRIAESMDKFFKERGCWYPISRAEEDRPCYDIYSRAVEVACTIEGDRIKRGASSVKLEHLVLAIACGHRKDWTIIYPDDCLSQFLSACRSSCKSEVSTSSSPEKKKMKYTEELPQQSSGWESPPSSKINLEKKKRLKEIMALLSGNQVPVIGNIVEYVRFLNNALINNSRDLRKLVFG